MFPTNMMINHLTAPHRKEEQKTFITAEAKTQKGSIQNADGGRMLRFFEGHALPDSCHGMKQQSSQLSVTNSLALRITAAP